MKTITLESWTLEAADNDKAVQSIVVKKIVNALGRPLSDRYFERDFCVRLLISRKNDMNVDGLINYIGDLTTLWNLTRIEFWESNGDTFRPVTRLSVKQNKETYCLDVVNREPLNWDVLVRERAAKEKGT